MEQQPQATTTTLSTEPSNREQLSSPSLPLIEKKCGPCHQNSDGTKRKPYTPSEARLHLDTFFPSSNHSINNNNWYLTHNSQRIRKDYTVRNFVAGIDFFQEIAQIAEEEGHHPDLRLEGYRNVTVEIYTHFVGGLTENDFVLAAKIDRLPVQLAKKIKKKEKEEENEKEGSRER